MGASAAGCVFGRRPSACLWFCRCRRRAGRGEAARRPAAEKVRRRWVLRSPVLPGDSVQRFLLSLQALCGPFGLGGAFEVSRARGEEERLRPGTRSRRYSSFASRRLRRHERPGLVTAPAARRAERNAVELSRRWVLQKGSAFTPRRRVLARLSERAFSRVPADAEEEPGDAGRRPFAHVAFSLLKMDSVSWPSES